MNELDVDDDIKYRYTSSLMDVANNLTINRVMKLKLLKRLDKENYTFKYLNSLGIKAIRGPRKIRKDLLK